METEYLLVIKVAGEWIIYSSNDMTRKEFIEEVRKQARLHAELNYVAVVRIENEAKIEPSVSIKGKYESTPTIIPLEEWLQPEEITDES